MEVRNREKTGSLREYLWKILSDISRMKINAHASSAAFFIFISFVPMLGFLCSLIPFTPVTEKDLMDFASLICPGMIEGLVLEIIREVYASSAGVLTISVIMMIWSASKSVMSLVSGLDSALDVEEKRNYFLIRFLACLYTVVILIGILVGLILIIFNNGFVKEAFLKLPLPVEVIDFIAMLHAVVVKPRALYMLIGLTLLFALAYKTLPDGKRKYRDQLPGAMLAAISWIIFSFFFSIYAASSKQLSLYGSLTTLVVAMLWLYICIYLFLVCAYLNSLYIESKKKGAMQEQLDPANSSGPEIQTGNEHKD